MWEFSGFCFREVGLFCEILKLGEFPRILGISWKRSQVTLALLDIDDRILV